ncbi:MAG: lytic transglycosylase domain-containing protein [Gammaproteobacteria bacterium]|nr:lytic transglycosylase domain-containing protein [Gammaproteobacteria bacterium]
MAGTVAAPTQPPDEKLKALLKDAVTSTESFEDRFDAQVWLLDMATRLGATVPEPDERVEILKAIHTEAARAQIQPELVLAVIQVESNFDRFAISRVGARGLMQIMPFWLDEIGRPEDNLFQIRTNLRYGCTILRHYLDMEKGHKARALARYNGSTGSWRYPRKVFSALDRRWYRQ